MEKGVLLRHLVLDADGALGVDHHVRDGDRVGVHAGAPRHRLDEGVLPIGQSVHTDTG